MAKKAKQTAKPAQKTVQKVAQSQKMTPQDPPKREFTFTRLVDAPLERVWKAWTDPKQMAQWWGPKDFTNPVCKWDAKPGNDLHIDMKGPDGTLYPMGGKFHEVEAPHKLVFTSTALDSEGNVALEDKTTVTFTEFGNQTKLTIVAVIQKATSVGETYLQGMNEGWNQSLDKLEALLKQKKHFMPHVARVLMGLMFFVFGLNGFLMFIPAPETMPPGPMAFLAGMMASGYMMQLVAGTQLVVGILLLANRYVPLALALIAPVIVNIILYHVFLDLPTIAPGILVFVLEVYLAWSYRHAFRPMLQAKTALE